MGGRDNRRRPARHGKEETGLVLGRQRVLLDRISFMISNPSYKITSVTGKVHDSVSLAKRYMFHLKNISAKFNVRIPKEARLLFCRKCEELMVPGRTARIRIRSSERITTCFKCGHTMRLSLKRRAAGRGVLSRNRASGQGAMPPAPPGSTPGRKGEKKAEAASESKIETGSGKL